MYGMHHFALPTIAFLFGFAIWLFKLKIYLGGLKYFNRFGNGKALVNLTPIILVGIIAHLLTIYGMLR